MTDALSAGNGFMHTLPANPSLVCSVAREAFRATGGFVRDV
ncbi:hypothetical protein SAMN05444358_10860 [Ruegeria halocynthiae]|uniref:Uncharacterized protein n=1 Tax=Ruegeria halocynthiae TaxID=985054 RepID=A0A1H3DCM3_9RHOB|nr:hypothetical protein SAMN05444358_10860 [Ruegeria halocynthiae]